MLVPWFNLIQRKVRSPLFLPFFTPTETMFLRCLAASQKIVPIRDLVLKTGVASEVSAKQHIYYIRNKLARPPEKAGLDLPPLNLYYVSDFGYLLIPPLNQREVVLNQLVPRESRDKLTEVHGENFHEQRQLIETICTQATVEGNKIQPFLSPTERAFLLLLAGSKDGFASWREIQATLEREERQSVWIFVYFLRSKIKGFRFGDLSIRIKSEREIGYVLEFYSSPPNR